MSVDGEDLRDGAQEVKEEATPWIRPLARLGYAANGIVYAAVGFLALQAALGPGGDADVNREEALARLVTEPFGQLLLLVIAVALVGYSLGHLLMAARSSQKTERSGVRDLANRAAHAGGGLLHLSLALAAAQLALGARGGNGGGRSTEDWTAMVLAQPLGRWLVGLAGLGVIGIGLYQLYKVFTATFKEAFKLDEMGKAEERWVVGLGRVGYSARAIVYGIVGWFLMRSAWQYDPDEAGGLGQALGSLSAQRYGPWLLGAVAAGFIAFGLYAIFLGRYREFDL
ncbi:MAG: DUF1206 domain-containing protein [bacterium]